MRVEEMYLIQAEATAMSGNLPGGKQILEQFVTRENFLVVRIGDGGGDRGARIIVAGGAERFVALYFCVGYRQSEHV